MALNPTYSVGTVSVSAGDSIVTGTGTLWLAGGIREGDVFERQGLSVTVLSVESNTQLTLVKAWPGTTGSGAYEVRYTADAARVIGGAREIIAGMEGLDDRVAVAQAAPFTPYQSFSEAVAGVKPPALLRVSASVAGRIVEWVRQSGGPCLGGGWVPADIATPQHFGTASGGWQVAINAALSWLSTKGGGRLLLPHIVGGYLTSGDVIIRDWVELEFEAGAFIKVADGSHNVRGIVTRDFVSLATTQASTSLAPRGWKVKNAVIYGNAANTTFDGGQYSGIGFGSYGYDFEIDGLSVYETHGHGIVTHFDGGASPAHGWNGVARNLYCQKAGRHGWWNRVSDIHVTDVSITEPSRGADNMYDGVLLERSARLANLNVWTTISTAGDIFPRHSLNCKAGGSKVSNAHLETGRCILNVEGQYNSVDAYLYYPRGEVMAAVSGQYHNIDLELTNNISVATYGVDLGRTGGELSYCDINVLSGGISGGVFRRINSAGNNGLRAKAFSTDPGVLLSGGMQTLDAVDVRGILGGVPHSIKKDAMHPTVITPAGTNFATATPLLQSEVTISGANGTAGVSLPAGVRGQRFTIYNSTFPANIVKVYPTATQGFPGLALGAAYDLPANAAISLMFVSDTRWAIL